MPTAPPGGFQQGGWYDGKQYWNGSFSAPGQIHQQSDQVGAGQLVSKEVNLQSDVAQGNKPGDIEKYLTQQRQVQSTTPQPTQQPVATTSGGFSTAGSTGASGASSMAMPEQANINLPDMYKGLHESSGISAIEADLAQKEKEYTEAKGVINDNPWLSEATRVGRIAKIESLFAERTANLRSDVATKKADIETQMNLELKQMDINSQAVQLAWQQFNTLLDMGALNNASGEDIASWTRQTGISSQMIQSAIVEKNKKDVKTSIIQSENDNGEVTVSVINSETGAVINQQSLGAVGTKTKVTGGSSGSTSDYKTSFFSDVDDNMEVDNLFARLVQTYAKLMSLQEIYRLYKSSSAGQKYGDPFEDASQIQEIYNDARGK